MNLDIRTPIGAMFSSFGLVLGPFGLLTVGRPDLYTRSLGLNANLWWGAAMLAFGLLMLVLGRRASRRRHVTAGPQPAGVEAASRPPAH